MVSWKSESSNLVEDDSGLSGLWSSMSGISKPLPYTTVKGSRDIYTLTF